MTGPTSLRLPTQKEILLEFESLRARLEEAEQTLSAIRGGEVDAIIVYGERGEQVYTLKGAQEPYRIFLEHMDEGAITLSADGTVLYSNQGFARLIELPLGRVMGSSLEHFVDPGDRAVLASLLAGASDGAFKAEMCFMRGRECVPTVVSAVRLGEEHEADYCLVVTDLSEQKKSREIMAAERLARSILDNAAEAIVVCDLDGKIIRANAEANRLSGTFAGAKAFGDCFDFRTENERFDPVRSTLGGRTVKGVEGTLRTTEGGHIDLLVSAGPLNGDDGRQIACVVTMADISDRNRAFREVRELNEVLEERVEERTEQLQAANRELEGFCYSVSHDLRGPLRTMMAASMMLIEDHGDQLDGEARSHLARLSAAAKRMATLIDDLLKFSRLGRQQMSKQQVDLTAAAESVGAEMVEREGGQHVKVVVEPAMVVDGDPMLLRMLLENLIGNAVKFSATNPAASIKVGSEIDNGRRVYHVKDNGIGFDMLYVEKIFQPFERLHTDREYPGTGIGLANVHRIVARHGGKVWADATLGEGATFYFTLGDSVEAPATKPLP